MMSQCSSRKIVFDSEGDARNAARHGKSPNLYPYRCPECGCWHLTSKGKKMGRKRLATLKAQLSR